ncbi:MAG: ABC transporter ATP-binding protein [Candidatus Thorarchaeota archaeon]|jgi:ABC-2 type transport system ATP-binding protein
MKAENLSIITEGIAKSFGSVKAVKGLDLSVPVGTRFALLGPNGAGKTTIVRMLSGLMKPTRGSASVCGYDIISKKDEVKAITGLLPETPGLYSKLSATEFLEFIGALNRLHGDILHRRIDALLSILGLEGRQNDLLESYSSGMKQKVLIASTLLHEPRVVFLDEPTSRLDPSASVLVKELIHALTEETNTTFFICTHMTSLAQDICDVIGILNEGELVTVGQPDSVVEAASAYTLEEAYLKIVGRKVDREALLAWR